MPERDAFEEWWERTQGIPWIAEAEIGFLREAFEAGARSREVKVAEREFEEWWAGWWIYPNYLAPKTIAEQAFEAGARSRDAEVERLRVALRECEAVLTEPSADGLNRSIAAKRARAALGEDGHG